MDCQGALEADVVVLDGNKWAIDFDLVSKKMPAALWYMPYEKKPKL